MKCWMPSARELSGKTTFITGTDTSVGKTVLASLLLVHLQRRGLRVRAIKPFCCGGRTDADLLSKLQGGPREGADVNPYYFDEPVAPLVAARKHHLQVTLPEVITCISAAAAKCDRVIVEGCGGLLVPLGEGYTVADLIARIACPVAVVARDQLGAINHTLLTVSALQGLGVKQLQVFLMSQREPDPASRSNHAILSELVTPVKVWTVPYLGPNLGSVEALRKSEKKVKKVLARLASMARL
jgi:dethiobiotin synthetase